MGLRVIRYHFGEKNTLGVMTLDGKFIAHTNEDVVRNLRSAADKVHGQTAIPAGTYKVAVTFSNKFQRETPQILNVPYF